MLSQFNFVVTFMLCPYKINLNIIYQLTFLSTNCPRYLSFPVKIFVYFNQSSCKYLSPRRLNLDLITCRPAVELAIVYIPLT